MTKLTAQPVIFALSNPTSSAECTAEQAYAWSGGKAIFASGSPFGPVEIDGKVRRPGQANNVHAFPGIGRGAIVARARSLPDSAFLAAARARARAVDAKALERGTLYPPLTRIRDVSVDVAEAVAHAIIDAGLSSAAHGDVAALVRSDIYEMTY